MTVNKETRTFGMPWESQYGYVQAVKVDDTIYVSGQLSHDDEGNMVGAAPLDDRGNIRDHSNMEIQMRQTYANAKKILAEFGATLDNVVEEVLYVTDMDKAFAAAGPVRKEAYGSQVPQVAYDSGYAPTRASNAIDRNKVDCKGAIDFHSPRTRECNWSGLTQETICELRGMHEMLTFRNLLSRSKSRKLSYPSPCVGSKPCLFNRIQDHWNSTFALCPRVCTKDHFSHHFSNIDHCKC